MNSNTESLIKANIDLIDTDLNKFFCKITPTIMVDDLRDLINVLEEAGIRTEEARWSAMHEQLTKVFRYYIYNLDQNQNEIEGLETYLSMSLDTFLGFTLNEIVQYTVEHRRDWSTLIKILPETRNRRALIVAVNI